MVFWESCVQLEQFLGTDLGLHQITINKYADFLIVTRQNPCFSRILSENRLHDQKNDCFLDRNLITASAGPLLRQKLSPADFYGQSGRVIYHRANPILVGSGNLRLLWHITSSNLSVVATDYSTISPFGAL